MTADHLLTIIVLGVVVAVIPIGWAVAQNPTLTAVAVVGVVGALLLAAHSLGSAAGISWHDRRAGLPSIRMEAPPSTGVPYLDAVRDAQIRELDSRTIERHGRAELARFGMEPREIPIKDWRVTAQAEGWPEEGFGE